MHVRVYVFSSTRVSFSLIFCFFSPFANAFNIKFNAILFCSLPSTRHFGISINKLDCLPSHMYLCVFYSTKEKRFIFLFFACMDHYRHGFIFYTLHPTHTHSLSLFPLALSFIFSFFLCVILRYFSECPCVVIHACLYSLYNDGEALLGVRWALVYESVS